MSTDLVVLTRTDADNRPLQERLEARGVTCLSYPCVATRPVNPDEADVRAVTAGGPIAALAFPSRRAVAGLLEHPALLAALDLPEDVLIGAVGPATARALESLGRPPAVTAEPATGASLAAALADRLPPGARVLVPAGDKLRPDLPEGLTARGLIPLPLTVYVHEPLKPPPLLPPPPAAVVCASPSAAETFLGANPGLAEVPFVAIGPTTEAALARLGVSRVTRAAATDPDSLTTAVLNTLGP